MSLTTGRAPFSANPAGQFLPALPSKVVYVEPFLRRVRARSGERQVIDSERVLLVHRQGQPPTYAFPEGDVHADVARTVEAAVSGYVRVAWDAVSAWYEEDEEVFGLRNPYHRIDCLRSQRRVRVELAGAVLVDTSDVVALFETSRTPDLYVPRAAVSMDRLVRSTTLSYCAYKGQASYWTALIDGKQFADVAWSYEEPRPECQRIAGMLCFYPDKANVTREALTWFDSPQPTSL